MNSKVKEVQYGSKKPIYYYQFSLQNFAPFRWYDKVHQYSFNSSVNPIAKFLRIGDSISVCVEENYNGDYFEVGNIAKNNVRILDVAERDLKAEEKASSLRNLSVGLFVFMVTLFSFLQMKTSIKVP